MVVSGKGIPCEMCGNACEDPLYGDSAPVCCLCEDPYSRPEVGECGLCWARFELERQHEFYLDGRNYGFGWGILMGLVFGGFMVVAWLAVKAWWL